MTRKKRRKQTGRQHRQRALHREREKLRRKRSEGPAVAVADTSPRRRGRPPKPEFKDSDLSGFKHFDELAPRFEALHEFGCG